MRWTDIQGQESGRRRLRWAWHKEISHPTKGYSSGYNQKDTVVVTTKGYSSGYNLADLCLQMAITNKARNLEK